MGMANTVDHLRWGRKSNILVVAKSGVWALLGYCRQGVWLQAVVDISNNSIDVLFSSQRAMCEIEQANLDFYKAERFFD